MFTVIRVFVVERVLHARSTCLSVSTHKRRLFAYLLVGGNRLASYLHVNHRCFQKCDGCETEENADLQVKSQTKCQESEWSKESDLEL